MNDLEIRLSAAGRSLRVDAERTADVDGGWADLVGRIRADRDGAVEVTTADRFDRSPVALHRWLAAAAALLVILGAAGTFVALTDPAGGPAASDPGADGTLFLLPRAGSGYEVSAGYVEDLDLTAAPMTFARESVAFGVPEGSGYGSLQVVHLYDGTPADDAEVYGTEPQRQTVQTDRGVFVVTETDFFRRVTHRLDGMWLSMDRLGRFDDDAVADAWVEQAIALLEATEVVDGSILVRQPPDGLVEIAREKISKFPTEPSVSYQVSGHGIEVGDDGSLATVDTVDWPTSIVLLAASTTAFVEPFTVGGREGWHATRPDGWQGLVWRADSGHMVAVSGDDDLEQLRALAESLVPVDEATWRTATGAAAPPAAPSTP